MPSAIPLQSDRIRATRVAKDLLQGPIDFSVSELLAMASQGGVTQAALTAAVAAASRMKVYGVTGGRVVAAKLSGLNSDGSTNGPTTLSTFTSTPIPMAYPIFTQGVRMDTLSKLTIVTPGIYTIHAWVRTVTGASGSRRLIVKKNGADLSEMSTYNTSGAAFNVTVGIPLIEYLVDGDVIEVAMYTEVGSVTYITRIANQNDSGLAVIMEGSLPVKPTLSGWAGAYNNPHNPGIRDITNTWLRPRTWAELATGFGNGFNELGNADNTAWLANYPNRATNIGIHMIPKDGNTGTLGSWNSQLDEVVAGTHDAQLSALGTLLAQKLPNTVFARIWWEMNIDFASVDPTKFANAWNRAVPLIRTAFNAAARAGQTIKFAYCYLSGTTGHEMDNYPGDTNVDIISADVYARIYGTTNPTVSQMMAQMRSELRALAVRAAQHNKPTGIDEYGQFDIAPVDGQPRSRGVGDAPGYIDIIYDFIEQNAGLYALYYDIDDDGPAHLNTVPLSLARMIVRGNAVSTQDSN